MKLTESVLDFVYKETYQYAVQIGISEYDIPNLIFTRKQVLGLEETKGRRNTSRYHGVWYYNINTIFYNIKAIKDRKRLRHVIIHELVHKRFPYLGHGPKYEKMIKSIEKGKVYPAYKPRVKKE